MTHQSQISIIIPVFNRAEIITRTLNSIAEQSLRPLDIVIVDNNSTDNTLQVIERWKHEHEATGFNISILTEPKPGACHARNKGLASISTPYVMFFDSDDTMTPEHTKNIIDTFNKNPLTDIVCWDITLHRMNGNKCLRRCHTKNILFNHIFHASFSTQRYAIKTEFIRQAGGWNNNLPGWNDFELGIRLLLKSPCVTHIEDGTCVNVFAQENSITGLDYSSSPHKWECALDSCSSILLNANEKRAATWIEVRRCILAGSYAREGDKQSGQRLLAEVLHRTHSAKRRLLFRFIYRYVKLGGRGVAYLAKLFL